MTNKRYRTTAEWIDQQTIKVYAEPVSAGRPHFNTEENRIYPNRKYDEFKRNTKKIMERDIGLLRMEELTELAKENEGYKATITCAYESEFKEDWGTPKFTIPDVDNLEKAVFDEILRHIGIKDGKIFRGTCEKIWDSENYIAVTIDYYKLKEVSRKNGGVERNKSKNERKKRVAKIMERRLKKREVGG